MSTSASGDAVRTVGLAGNPPVLLLHPWWGITAAVNEWADDLANVGRRVLLPDLYSGKTVNRHWFAERSSPGFDEPAFALARSRVIEQLRV